MLLLAPLLAPLDSASLLGLGLGLAVGDGFFAAFTLRSEVIISCFRKSYFGSSSNSSDREY